MSNELMRPAATQSAIVVPPEAGPWKSALVGVVLGVDAIGNCLALATICFVGAMTAGLGLATAIFIFGTLFCTIVLFQFGGFRTVLAVSQDTTISILAPAVVLAASAVSGSVDAKVATALAAIGVSALASGAVFWLTGRLGLGRLVRMFPYPVAAGFLASSGFLLVFAAFSVVTEETRFATIAKAALDPAIQLRLIPAVLMALAMVIAMRIWSGASSVLVVVFLSLAGYYVIAALLGIDHDAAMALGILPRIDASATSGLDLAMLGLIDWSAVASIAPTVAAVVLLNLIGVLLNTSGVELATRSDVDENKELRVTGLSNILIGALGGLTCYIQGGATVIAAKMRVQPGALLIGHSLVLLCAIFAAPRIVSLVPTFIPSALLMFIGLSMLTDWLLGTRKRLTLSDWLIVVAIVLATMILGILPAIGIGLMLAVLGFAYASIRLPIMRFATDISQRHSVRDWSILDGEVLLREGHRVRVLYLQGPLFFGSVEQLISNLRKIARSETGISAVIIDFAEVHSFDSSACAALDKLLQILTAHRITAHVTGLSPGLREVFDRWGLPVATGGTGTGGGDPAFRRWDSLDAAIEHCEVQILSETGRTDPQDDIAAILFDLGRRHPRVPELVAHMQRQALDPGDVLIRANDTSGDVYFLASGHLAVVLPQPGHGGLRVRTMAPGAIVGEVAYLTGRPRNADVICVEPAVVFCLSAATISRIEKEDRDLAALMMSIFGRSLAVKLAQTNNLLTNSQLRSVQRTGPKA